MPWYDPAHNFSRGLDLSQPIPQFQANPPQMPAEATAIVGSNFWKWNGQWQWTDSGHPGMWNAPKLALQPRAGIAIRVNDKTSLRAGYARYTIPTEFNLSGFPGFETVSFLEPPYFGVTSYQNTAPLLQGIPQQTFSNPFPPSNPLLPILGKQAGGNVGRGQNGALLWYKQDFKKAYNDRINVSIQHQLPGQLVVMATYFTNFGHQLYNKALNNIDPNLQLKYQNRLNDTVPNPFYHYLDQTVMPGPLYNQQTVSLGSLLVPYPAILGAGRVRPLLRGGTLQFARTASAEDLHQRLQRAGLLRVYPGEEPDLLQRSGHVYGQPDVAGQRSAAPSLHGGQHLRTARRQGQHLLQPYTQGSRLRPGRLEAHRGGRR